MNQINPEELLNKYKAGECTVEELALVQGYIVHEGITPQDLLSMEDELEEYKTTTGRLPLKIKRRIWPGNLLMVAATIIVVCGLFTLLSKEDTNTINYAGDVQPGGNKAVLTLENGQKIQLSDAKSGIVVDASKLTYNDGTVINNEQSKTFSISTPRGGTYQVRLPDGSVAWLNSASSLTYSAPLKGDGGSRRVKMTGEAYFEVAKDKEHPFVVSTDKQTVTVLGTHFNINSYTDEPSVKTTLLEGSVRVDLLSASGGAVKGKAKVLKPGMQAVNTGTALDIKEVDPGIAIAWKNGEFAFKNESLEDIMKNISRWYDVEVVFEDEAAKRKVFGGSISKFEKASKVLCMLELTGDVKFKISDGKIIVTN
ncbi:FecR family protein [Pedobacter gandavensis]|uniref:FecR family protein n=1 Tax=Pedobacter gandavensis TaxID=2679963 RepID=UPI00292F93B2|nr:FecR domain-containing protein [Pedobacter gandavensis]